jgi:glycosyltransferase involved in cell wall biosynthesis
MDVVVVDPGHQVPNYDRALVAALAAGGHRVTFAAAPSLYFSPAVAPGVTSWPAFGRLLRPPLVGRWSPAAHPHLRRLLRVVGYAPELVAFGRRLLAHRPDVVHFQWSLIPPLDAALLGHLRRHGLPVVYTAHNVLPHEPRRWHPAAYRRLYRSADGVTVHSEASRRRLARLSGLPADRIAVLPMPADEPSDIPDRPAARDRLGLPVDAPLVLFLGQVRPYKGLVLLLDALPALVAGCPGARLVVAGHVPGGPRAVGALSRSLAARGLAGAVELRPGYLPPVELTAYLAAADVVALPYRATDDSAVLAAARGHGRAVVATAAGGLREALAAGGGLGVPPGDAVALAEALFQVLTRPGLRECLEDEARAAARAWTWGDMAAQLGTLYARLAGASVG